ncbi:hypothetical protein TGGT1_209200 [Toxoplasma gondii GT1]|uniref:Uncharacterized protein n=2 Tax=Toxoplasma gondii TaxID=5811 RepID=A0A125YG29_TOXGG|nr:hypothetical protein TGGT1_209200 [Toxoplasma gondii GT1]KAF4645913.1 hypothetical protein TGRH88_021890 [Toxoplasma gondii]CAJ20620.1 hypothetical protein TgIb.1470 [Toxoplasma gondii RH]
MRPLVRGGTGRGPGLPASSRRQTTAEESLASPSSDAGHSTRSAASTSSTSSRSTSAPSAPGFPSAAASPSAPASPCASPSRSYHASSRAPNVSRRGEMLASPRPVGATLQNPLQAGETGEFDSRFGAERPFPGSDWDASRTLQLPAREDLVSLRTTLRRGPPAGTHLTPQPLDDDEFTPRDPLEGRQNGPLNRVYMRRQKDGAVFLYVSAQMDQHLLRAFSNYSFNGYMTVQKWVQLCIDAELYPRNKDPDLLRHIFRGLAHDGMVIEFCNFLRLLLRLARYKFRMVRNMSDEDALNALLVHLFCFPRLFLSGARLQDCGVQAGSTYQDACVGPTILSKEQGVLAIPTCSVSAAQTFIPTEDKEVTIEPAVTTAETMTLPVELLTAGTQTEKEEEPAKPPQPKSELVSRDTMTDDVGKPCVVFLERQNPQMEECIALEGKDDSELYTVFCSCSEYNSETFQNLITERACAVLCKDSGIMEVLCHPKSASVSPQQARVIYREVVASRSRRTWRPGSAGKGSSSNEDRSGGVWTSGDAREGVADGKDPAQAVLEALENAEDFRLSYPEFKLLLYKFSRVMYEHLKPRTGFLRIVRDKVLRNFFARSKTAFGKPSQGEHTNQREASDGKRGFGYDIDDDAASVAASGSPPGAGGTGGLLSQASTRRPSKAFDATDDEETNACYTSRTHRGDPSPRGRESDRYSRANDVAERAFLSTPQAAQFGPNPYGFLPYYMTPTMYPSSYSPAGVMPTFPGGL